MTLLKQHKITLDDPIDISNTVAIPPKSSLSILIYLNDIPNIKNKIKESKDCFNITDNEGFSSSWTPLYWAVKLRRIECIKILLENGVNINTVVHDLDECCGTVLDLVSIRKDTDIENILRTYMDQDTLNQLNLTTYTSLKTRPRGGKPPHYVFHSSKNKNNLLP